MCFLNRGRQYIRSSMFRSISYRATCKKMLSPPVNTAYRYLHNDKSWPISSDILACFFLYLKRRDVLCNRKGRTIAQCTDACRHAIESWCWLFMQWHVNTDCALKKLNISLYSQWYFSENPLKRHCESSIHLYFST